MIDAGQLGGDYIFLTDKAEDFIDELLSRQFVPEEEEMTEAFHFLLGDDGNIH